MQSPDFPAYAPMPVPSEDDCRAALGQFYGWTIAQVHGNWIYGANYDDERGTLRTRVRFLHFRRTTSGAWQFRKGFRVVGPRAAWKPAQPVEAQTFARLCVEQVRARLASDALRTDIESRRLAELAETL